MVTIRYDSNDTRFARDNWQANKLPVKSSTQTEKELKCLNRNKMRQIEVESRVM